MKILCGPDLHCWPPTYERSRKGERPSRLIEWETVGQEMVKQAVSHGVDLALFPGDFYMNSKPESKAEVAVVNLLKQFRKNGIRVIGCNGNHDYSTPGEENPIHVIATHDPDWGITKPGIVFVEDIAFIISPYQKPSELDPSREPVAVSKKLLEQALELLQIAEDANKARQFILMGHWAISGATYANGFGPNEEPCFYVEDLTPFDAVVMGHIHKPQVLSEHPLVLHTGVATRIKSDETAPCGFYLLDTEDMSYEFVELSARKIVTINFSRDAIANYITSKWKMEVPEVTDTIVVAKYTASEEESKKVNHREIREYLKDQGAYFVAAVNPNILRAERERKVQLSEEMSPVRMFELWAADAGEKKEFIHETKSILEEVVKQVV
jgi:exonuclease SbcD